MASFYTGRGDAGYTDLLGARILKSDPHAELIGTLDESTSQIGLARAQAGSGTTRDILESIQRDLYKMMAELAFVSDDLAAAYRTTSEDLGRVGELTDQLAADVPLAREFILPGDSLPGAALDVARAVVRRAERVAVGAYNADAFGNELILAYLNRLSSLLFVLARFEDQVAGVEPKTAKGDDSQ